MHMFVVTNLTGDHFGFVVTLYHATMQDSQQSISKDAYVMSPLNVAQVTYTKVRNSQCYRMTSEGDRQFRLLISEFKLFSILLDIVIECSLEDTDHPGPNTMNVQIFNPESEMGEALMLKKISRLVWEHHGNVKLYVSLEPPF